MIKKLLTAVLACVIIAALASCGCANNTAETQPTSKPIDKNMQIGEFAAYVTQPEWINNKTGDTINFKDDGSFEGKINGKNYSGTFTLRIDKNKLGRLISSVTLTGEKKPVEYTIDFDNTASMTLTTDKGESEKYVVK